MNDLTTFERAAFKTGLCLFVAYLAFLTYGVALGATLATSKVANAIYC